METQNKKVERKATSAYDYVPKGTARRTEKGNIVITLEDGTQYLIREVKSEKVLFHYKKLTDKVYDNLVVDQLVLARPELKAQHPAESKQEKVELPKLKSAKVVHNLKDYTIIYKDYINSHKDLKGLQLLKQHRQDVLEAIKANPKVDFKQTLINIDTTIRLAKAALKAKASAKGGE